MKYKIQINIADKYGTNSVLDGCSMKLPARKMRRLFKGDFCEVLCLKPGKTVRSIEIHEIPVDSGKS